MFMPNISYVIRPGLRSFSRIENSISRRQENFSKWYLDIISQSDLAESSPVKGCVTLKPSGYELWELIKNDLDTRMKSHNIKNVYLPLLVPSSFLSKEAAHVDGFAKECAVVTHHRLRINPEGTGVEVDPSAVLSDPLVVRPTSETLMWDAFHRWVKSYRDLPLIVNQWANVMRWEMRTRPFLRTSEFLWQEGHAAHADASDAYDHALKMACMYERLLQDTLGIFSFRGEKSISERFAGADSTFTCEVILQNGWALQSATAHVLGTHFSDAFNVKYKKSDGALELAQGTSWGASTRLIGALLMTHGDDAGVVLPPAVAPTQVVIVAIGKKNDVEGIPKLKEECEVIMNRLRASGVRTELDSDLSVGLGTRLDHWDAQGVPLKIEVGLRDLESGGLTIKRRDNGKSVSVAISSSNDLLIETVQSLLKEIQSDLYLRSKERALSCLVRTDSFEELQAFAESTMIHNEHEHEDTESVPLDSKDTTVSKKSNKSNLNSFHDYSPTSKVFLVPWCEDATNEFDIKLKTKFTLRCYPHMYQEEHVGKICFYSGRPATHMALFARAY